MAHSAGMTSSVTLSADDANITNLGSRGIVVSNQGGKVDIRKFWRDFKDANVLHGSNSGISLSMGEWFDLVSYSDEIDKQVQACIAQKVVPVFFKPIGHSGVHAVVSIFKDTLLVSIRQFTRSFDQPGEMFAMQNGIALKTDEWADLAGEAKAISERLVIA